MDKRIRVIGVDELYLMTKMRILNRHGLDQKAKGRREKLTDAKLEHTNHFVNSLRIFGCDKLS